MIGVVSQALAQVPKIDAVQEILSYPSTSVKIIGSGFSSTATDLIVRFGSVKGTITASTETTITVTVPPQARVNVIEVINLVSKRSGYSVDKFIPTFSGKSPFTTSFASTSFTNADDIFDLCSCDFDGDGLADIAGSKFKEGKANLMLLRNQSTVSANNSTISFAQSSITLPFPTFSVTCGDLNGDGKPELIATRGGSSTGSTVFVFQNTSTVGTITFAAPVQLNLTAGDFAKEVAVRDLDGDGKPEIIVANGQTNTFYIFDNNLTTSTIVAGEFSRVDITAGVANTLSLEVQDFNEDGWPDIALTSNVSATSIYVMRNPANGTLNFTTGSSNTISIGGSSNINDITSADFDNDGKLDFVIADRSSNKAFVYLNKGNMLFASVNGATGFSSPVAWGVDVADMNGDGHVDFVTGNRSNTDPAAPQVNFYINNGAATPSFTQSTIMTTKPNWYIKAADFDGDSKPDLAVTATNFAASFSIDILKNKNCHVPVILNENPLAICNPQTLTLKAVALQGVAYTWSTGGTGASEDITVADAGVITLTAVGEGGACSTQSTITVNAGAGTAPAKPSITSPAIGVCSGTQLTLGTAAVAGATYLWSGPNDYASSTNTPSATVSASAVLADAGDYVLQVQVGDCISEPSDPKSITVVAPDNFTISSNVGADVCSGQAVTLSVTAIGGYDYQWKKGGADIGGAQSSTFNIASAGAANEGAYTVFVSHQTITCSSETDPFNLNVLTPPVASFTMTPAVVCVGTEVTFTNTSTVDGGATAQFAWNFGDTGTGTGASPKHTYVAANGSVTATLTVSYTGVTGCSAQDTKNFAVNAAIAPAITAVPAVTEICANGSESVQLSVAGTFNSTTWSTSATTSSITITLPGTYSVVTVDGNGCTGNAQLVLTEKPGCAGGGGAEIDVTVPKVFTPNDDLQNDLLLLTGNDAFRADCSMTVFDGRGRRVYEVKGFPVTGWDGKASAGGTPLPDGTYYYVFGCPNAKPITGAVLIVR